MKFKKVIVPYVEKGSREFYVVAFKDNNDDAKLFVERAIKQGISPYEVGNIWESKRPWATSFKEDSITNWKVEEITRKEFIEKREENERVTLEQARKAWRSIVKTIRAGKINGKTWQRMEELKTFIEQ